MAQSLKDIKNRIRSITSVSKVTRTMEMVSIAKLMPARNQLAAAGRYFLKIDALLKNLAASRVLFTHPYLKKRSGPLKKALCLITSDTGLCAAYNNNVIRLAEAFMDEHCQAGAMLFTVGKKGFSHFKRRGVDIANAYIGLNGRYSEEMTKKILKDLVGVFLSLEIDEVHVAYTYFESASRFRPRIEKFLNIDLERQSEADFILEPDINGIVAELLPVYIFNKFKLIFLNAFASEHSSRVIAMGQASENADELLEGLVLSRNKVRQANITKEIMEIISSVEVLR